MRKQNGSGSIVKLKGSRRKPYMVRLPAMYLMKPDGELKEDRKILGYFATKKEAEMGLAEYMMNPYDVDGSSMTFKDLYSEFKKHKFPEIAEATQSRYELMFKKCECIHHKKFKDMKVKDFQLAIDKVAETNNISAIEKCKQLLTAMSDYAMKNDYINKNYATYVDISRYRSKNPNQRTRTIFTDEEISKLWETFGHPVYDRVLVLIYTGLRANEFVNVRKEDVDFDDMIIKIRKSKTDAGVRIVPIADKIYPIVKRFYDNSISGYVFENMHTHSKSDCGYFRNKVFQKGLEKIGMNHMSHDARHTCTTMLKEAGVDNDIIDAIIGHANTKSITINTYTHFQVKTLRDAINKI